jgi:hypothetical protein
LDLVLDVYHAGLELAQSVQCIFVFTLQHTLVTPPRQLHTQSTSHLVL